MVSVKDSAQWPGQPGRRAQGALTFALLTWRRTVSVHVGCFITDVSLFLLCKSFKLRVQSDLKGNV